MLARFLVIVGSIWLTLFVKKRRAISCGGEDRISALSDDLLLKILLFVPTQDAVATMILSKRWQFVWTMFPELEYKDIEDGTRERFRGGLLCRLFGKTERPKSIWRFLNESLRLHKALRLETLIIQLGPHCPVDVNVGKWIANAVARGVHRLMFDLMWSAEPISSLPKSLYISDTLVHLRLSNKVLLDISSRACLPSLRRLDLICVVYKDEDSIVRLLSSCPILKHLYVVRHDPDNVTNFSIKVPSLETLAYICRKTREFNERGSLVIDSAILKKLFITYYLTTNSCLIENKPRLSKAIIHVCFDTDDKLMTSLSSVMYLEIFMGNPTAACFYEINFSQLLVCKIHAIKLDWFGGFVSLLQNSPKLRVVAIDQTDYRNGGFPVSWNQPSFIPLCLSTNLEIFEWKEYGGTTGDKQLVRYILANSKCLKRAGISLKCCNRRDRKKMEKELECMSRISASSQLLFSTQFMEFVDYVDNDMLD